MTRLLNLLTGLSLLLCVAVFVLWVRSFYAGRSRSGGFPGDDRLFQTGFVSSFEGSFLVEWYRQLGPPSPRLKDDAFSAWSFQSRTWEFEFRRFRGADGDNPNRQYTFVGVPHWCPMLVFGTLPAWRLWPILRLWRRRPPGVCVACGYDLRATPERCPECGAVPPGNPLDSRRRPVPRRHSPERAVSHARGT
jgi:hypothetical protein